MDLRYGFKGSAGLLTLLIVHPLWPALLPENTIDVPNKIDAITLWSLTGAGICLLLAGYMANNLAPQWPSIVYSCGAAITLAALTLALSRPNIWPIAVGLVATFAITITTAGWWSVLCVAVYVIAAAVTFLSIFAAVRSRPPERTGPQGSA
jgi:uncharacterized membrane protein